MNERNKVRRTALVLSGGGSRGAYQCGVWQALSELGIKIDIVVGVSVGAINGAMVVQGDVIKTANLWREMETDMVFDVDAGAQIQDFAVEFFKNLGAGSSGLQNMLPRYVDEDAIRRSPIDFGLLTVEVPSMKPHYLWKEMIPDGKLFDYITASASAFPAVHAYDIDGKRFIDGGYEDNLPVSMALEKNPTEIIAVYLDAIGRVHPAELKKIPNLTLIESKWNLGDFLVFDTKNTKRILRIGYLDAMKTFDIYDGAFYTFVKGAFDKRTLRQADYAARIFDLDPLILYRAETFKEVLTAAVTGARREMSNSFDFDISDFTSLSKMKNLMKAVNKKTAVLLLADSMMDRTEGVHLFTKYTRGLFKEEVGAAELLVKWGLL
ncbi:MAG: patatin-like phospholipase family protein [Emergencia sp.]